MLTLKKIVIFTLIAGFMLQPKYKCVKGNQYHFDQRAKAKENKMKRVKGNE